MKERRWLIMALPLFLAIFIDGMGMGILFPILTAIIADRSHSILASGTPINIRNLLYGITIAAFSLAWFIGAPILSDLSDRTGRKKPLVFSLFGTCIGYILSIIAVAYRSISLLIIGRLIAGFTAGSQPIAQAAIIDLSTPENRTRNLGYILLSVSLGFVVGPLVGAFLSDSQLVSWFDYTTPFYFAALVSFLNALFIGIYFKETFKTSGISKIRFGRALELFADAFRNKNIRYLSTAFLFLQLAWGAYFSFSSLFLHAKFNYNTQEIGFYITLMAIGFGLGFAYIVNFVAHRFMLKNTVMVSAFLVGIFILMTTYINTPIYVWIIVAFLGMSMAVAFSSTITLYSNQVDETQQGWAMGISNAVGAASFGIATLFAGFIAEIGLTTTLTLAAAFALISSVLISFFPQKK